jgi:uncharacterized protein (TIGR02145 family)
MFSLSFCLTAQDITISFQPKIAGTQIDSIWVTNQKTDQKVRLLGNESLVLTKTTGIDLISDNQAEGYFYPNPIYGDASLSFSTSENQEVEVRISNISGQVLALLRQELSPGQHTFKLKFPVIGLYAVSVLKEDEPLCLKAVYAGVQKQKCIIEYSGSGSPEHLKSAVVEKTLNYKLGDILFYSVFSAKNNTIITDSPSITKVYSVEFYERIDFDKNSYKVVKIGSQVWMAENLKTTKYRDGSSIQNVTDNTEWGGLTSGAYCWYNNEINNKATKGALYNFYAVKTQMLCPSGWWVPSDSEWKQLAQYISEQKGPYNFYGASWDKVGRHLKTTSGWYNDGSGTDDFGFSGLCGGLRYYEGNFSYVGLYEGDWWSSTENKYCKSI